jgi:hypothetical protein
MKRCPVSLIIRKNADKTRQGTVHPHRGYRTENKEVTLLRLGYDPWLPTAIAHAESLSPSPKAFDFLVCVLFLL